MAATALDESKQLGKMKLDRRKFIKGMGGIVSPAFRVFRHGLVGSLADAFSRGGQSSGYASREFFPDSFGKDYSLPTTLRSLNWLKDRLTIVSHTDHGMVSGHGREISFLSGILPQNSSAYPEKNISIDQLVARRAGSKVRFPSIHAALERGIRMSWNSNGFEIKPFTDPQKLFDRVLFQTS